MSNELKTIGGALAVAATGIAAGVTFGQVKAVNKACEDTAKFTAKAATNTGVAKVGKAIADPTDGDKWKEAGCGVLNSVPIASQLVGVSAEIAKPIKNAVKGERYSGFDISNCLQGGNALERAIDGGRNKSSGIWVGKRALGSLGGAVQIHVGGHLNVYHTAIILDGEGYSFDPNSNGNGQDLQTFRHDSREAGTYEWKKIAGHSVKKSPASIRRKAQGYARDYNLLGWNCQIFCQKMAEYASDSTLIDSGVAF